MVLFLPVENRDIFFLRVIGQIVDRLLEFTIKCQVSESLSFLW